MTDALCYGEEAFCAVTGNGIPNSVREMGSLVRRDGADLIASAFGKKHVCFVASGMAAIELALEVLGVRPHDEVLLPDNVCHTVPFAVLRAPAKPRFVTTGAELLMSVEAIAAAVRPKTAVVIAVHLHGLPFPVRSLRNALPDHIRIIEDCSQAFGVITEGDNIGVHADLVITSLGPTKPLSIGGGGALIGDGAYIPRLMERSRDNASSALFSPRPYLLPSSHLHGLRAAISLAEHLVRQRRDDVARHTEILRLHHLRLWTPPGGSIPSWHKVPVYPVDAAARKRVVEDRGLENFFLNPISPKTSELPIFNKMRRETASDIDLPFLIKPERLRDFARSLDSRS